MNRFVQGQIDSIRQSELQDSPFDTRDRRQQYHTRSMEQERRWAVRSQSMEVESSHEQ